MEVGVVSQTNLTHRAVAELAAIAIRHPNFRLCAFQERGHNRGGTRGFDHVANRRRTQQHPLPPGLAANPLGGLIGADNRAGTSCFPSFFFCSLGKRRIGVGAALRANEGDTNHPR